MLMLRLSRTGKTKQPTYRLIVSEKAKDPWGKYLEILGVYNPRVNPKTILFKADRIKFWLEKGAQASDTVYNLLINQGIITGEKRKKGKISKKRAARLAEKKKAAASAAKEPGHTEVTPTV